MTTVIVNIEKGIAEHGDIITATRRAWPLSATEAATVSSVVGLVKGEVRSVIVGCYCVRDEEITTRFRFEGGEAYAADPKTILVRRHPLFFKRLGGTRGHRYASSINDLIEQFC